MVFSMKSPDDLAKEVQAEDARIDALNTKIGKLEAIRAMFNRIAGWEAFRDEYLVGVRLRQLQKACADSLLDDERTRARVRGQLDELKELCSAPDELDTRIQHMVQDRTETMKRRAEAQRKLERKIKR